MWTQVGDDLLLSQKDHVDRDRMRPKIYTHSFEKMRNVKVEEPNWDHAMARLKKRLHSRNLVQQQETVHELTDKIRLHFKLNEGDQESIQSLVSKLIDSDILQFLCIDSSASNYTLMGSVFECLEWLMLSEKFFNRSHPTIVLEYSARLLNLEIKRKVGQARSSANDVLISGLHMLEIFGARAAEHGAKLSGCDVRQILELVMNVFENALDRAGMMALQAAAVLANILRTTLVRSELKAMVPILAKAIKQCYTELTILVNNKSPDDIAVRACSIMAMVGLNATKVPSELGCKRGLNDSDQSKSSPSSNGCLEKYNNLILNPAVENMEEVCTPYIAAVTVDRSRVGLYANYLDCLKSLYRTPGLEKSCVRLSHKLAECGYLTLLPLLSRTFKPNSPIRAACLTCLAELLTSLASDVLSLSDYPRGAIGLRAHLLEGARHLHRDPNMWFVALTKERVSESYELTVVLFAFFYCLATQGSGRSPELFPALIVHLKTKYSTALYQKPSIVFTRAIWLTFAVCTLDHKAAVSGLDGATKVLIGLLEQRKLVDVFTPHPALLNWSFSHPKIPSRLRTQVIQLWLQSTSSAESEILVNLLLEQPTACASLLDVLHHLQPVVASRAIAALNTAITGQEGLELVTTMWEKMPTFLANISSDNSSLSASGVGNLLTLACSRLPPHIDPVCLAKTASLLSGVIIRQAEADADTHLDFFIGALQLIWFSLLQSTDQRIMQTYVASPGFMQVLQKVVDSPETLLRSITYKILSYFLKVQTQQISPNFTCKQVTIATVSILHSLTSDNEILVRDALQCTYMLLESKVSTVVSLQTMSDTERIAFIRTLMIRLQGITVKFQLGNPHLTACSWRCQSSLLRYSARLHPVILAHVVAQPWTLHLLSHLSVECCSTEALRFICDWLALLPRRNDTRPKRKGAARVDVLTPTLAHLAATVMGIDDRKKRGLAIRIMNAILLVDSDLLDAIVIKLQNQVQQGDVDELKSN